MKVTENRLDTLIDNLNTLICEDSLLTRQERETLGGRGRHRRHESARRHEKAAVPASSKPKEEKQAPVPDPRFPECPPGLGG